MSTSPPALRPGTTPLPPEQRFWQRYSPHHEAPLSGAGSFALHLVVVGVLLLAGYVGWLGINSRPSRPNVDTVLGPAGNEKQTDPPPGDVSLPVNDPAAGNPTGSPKAPLRPETPTLPPVPPPATANVPLPNQRSIRDPEFNDPLDVLERIGRRGFTSGRAEPTGGTPDGNATKPSGTTGIIRNKPVPRGQRWDLRFNTRDGRDYVRQMQGLGAVLAIPTAPGGAGYKVIRDLSRRPVQLLDEDVSTIPGICWRDENPQSVTGVMQALGLNLRPGHFAAFLPEELEQKLARLEREFAGRAEMQIARTRFRVVVTGGKYDVQVIGQEPLR